ncbi:MAG: AAA family ATPase [Candidatus Paceibacterota bacterium]
MYKIHQIKLRGFRGYPDLGPEEPFRFQFSDSVNLIFGPNRAGKSSLLSSLEWALFGSKEITKIGDTEIPRQRKNWQIPHRKSDQTKIKVSFSSEDNTIELSREKDKSPTLNGEVSEVPAREFGITKSDYFSTVHLHQQTIQNLLTATPKERKNIFYSLLGLSEFKEINELLNDWVKYQYSTQMQEQLDEKIQALQGNFDELERTKQDILKEADFKETDCNEEKINEICQEVIEELDQFCDQAGLDKPDLDSLLEAGERDDFFDQATKTINQLRTESPAQKRLDTIDNMIQKRGRLSSKIEDLERKISELGESIEKIARKKDEDGEYLYTDDGSYDSDNLPNLIDNVIEKMEETHREKHRAWQKETKQADLISKAEEYIEKVDGLNTCPVCGSSTSLEEVSNHLREHSKTLSEKATKAKGREEELKELIKQAKKDKEQAETDLEDLESAQSEGRNQLKESLDGFMETIQGKLPTEEFDFPSITEKTVLSKACDRLEEQLDGLREQVEEEAKKKHNTLNEYKKKLERAKKMKEVLDNKIRMQELQKYRDSKCYQNADAIIASQARNEYEMFVLSEAVSQTRQKLVSQRLRDAQETINDFFHKISKRNYFSEIKVDDDLNLYGAQQDERVDLRAIHNQGDLNSAALSLFLGIGIGEQISHQLGFTIFDDPAQSLDEEHKKGFIRLLEEVAAERQVFLATHDEKMYEELKHSTVPVKVFELSNWNVENGPDVETVEMK